MSRAAPIGLAPAARDTEPLARKLPDDLRMGTSSWSFPGWDGLVYDGAFSKQRLAREGLEAYAAHPLFRAVGVDRTHYAPIDRAVFERYAAQVPPDFRFLVKAHELCSLARFPRHARYGTNRGRTNPLFLDPVYASEAVIEPFAVGLGAKAGPLLFQFAPQSMELLGGPQRFAENLFGFLSRLPRGPLYAVEVRNPTLLTAEYAAALADAGACHCINLIGNMPDPLTQWQATRSGDAPALVIRWMLMRALTYEQAFEQYEPFNAIVDPDPRARRGIAQLICTALDHGQPVFVIANNKAEGSAPLSIASIAKRLTV